MSDLAVHTDILQLYRQFSLFSASELVGVGRDLSPHYRLNLEQYRRWHPASTMGDPGPNQVTPSTTYIYIISNMTSTPGFQHRRGAVQPGAAATE